MGEGLREEVAISPAEALEGSIEDNLDALERIARGARAPFRVGMQHVLRHRRHGRAGQGEGEHHGEHHGFRHGHEQEARYAFEEEQTHADDL